MELKEIKRLTKIAHDAGLRVDEWDYGWSVGAWSEEADKGLVSAEVFRAERDGYIGGRVICEDVLRDWIKENQT